MNKFGGPLYNLVSFLSVQAFGISGQYINFNMVSKQEFKNLKFTCAKRKAYTSELR